MTSQNALSFRLGFYPKMCSSSRFYEQITFKRHTYTHTLDAIEYIRLLNLNKPCVCVPMRHVQFSTDKSNWLLITEYDFDNNRHGFAAFIQYVQSRQGRYFTSFPFTNRINVMNTRSFVIRYRHRHTRGNIQFNNKLNYG